MISWCWTLMLLRDSPALSPAPGCTRVLASIWLHATHVRRVPLVLLLPEHRSHRRSARPVLRRVRCFPSSARPHAGARSPSATLVAESEAQVCRDGVHFEQSTCYHRYSVDTYLHFLLLADRNGIDLPEHIARTRAADGGVPARHSPDRRRRSRRSATTTAGACCRCRTARGRRRRGLFAVAAALFRRRDFALGGRRACARGRLADGPRRRRRFRRTRAAAPPASAASRVFPSGGYASMRSGWEPDAHQAIVDIGPIGCPVSGGHGHADLLSLQCSIFGEPCLVDAGHLLLHRRTRSGATSSAAPRRTARSSSTA